MMIVIASADSKRRMVESAALLFRERGYSGTGFRDVIAHSGAPRGSIYHHFPGGKSELAAETVRYAGDVVAGRLERAARNGDPVVALRTYLDGWRRALESSDFRAGCPVLAVAVETHDDSGVADAAAEAFGRWERMFGAILRDAGVPRTRAARVATLTVAAIEGAVVLCRAERSTKPLRDVGGELEAVIAAARGG
jgi:AcrR family transcriptional regulator